MLRWMVSPIIGSGAISDPYRASVSDVPNVNSSSLIPTNQSGAPDYRFAFSLVATASIAAISAVTNSYVFPDYPLDSQMGGMDLATRNAMAQDVAAYDMDGNGYHLSAANVDTDSYRSVITEVGQGVESVFNPSNMSCAEVSV